MCNFKTLEMQAIEFEKLKLFVTPNRLFLTEQDTLYLLVYIRKYLERTDIDIDEFLVLLFYANWALHTEKNRGMKDIKEILDGIQTEIYGFSQKDEKHLERFLGMEQLKSELSLFLSKLKIIDFTNNKTKWFNFSYNLKNILVGCPLKVKEKGLEITYEKIDGKTLRFSVIYS
jgi:hypothetical protein